MNTSLSHITRTALTSCRNLNCWTAAITKKHRKLYLKTYETVLVLPHGGTINIEYPEPRKIIILPLNVAEVSEDVRRRIFAKRRPKTQVVIKGEITDNFDENRYLQMLKR